jgi:hypothetical protein
MLVDQFPVGDRGFAAVPMSSNMTSALIMWLTSCRTVHSEHGVGLVVNVLGYGHDDWAGLLDACLQSGGRVHVRRSCSSGGLADGVAGSGAGPGGVDYLASGDGRSEADGSGRALIQLVGSGVEFGEHGRPDVT